MKTPILFFVMVFVCSCKNVNLFQLDAKEKNPNSTFEILSKDFESTIKPDDKLSISVWNHDNISIGSAYSIYNTNESFGKWVLVEQDGTTKIPKLGELNFVGMTLSEAEDTLTTLYGKTIQNPIVEIKILNAEISVLGEVNQPGRYTIEKEINTLVELISRAQGLTSYAKKSKIEIIRDNVAYVVDLTSMSQFQQSNLILKNGDIIYVPATKTKTLHERAPTIIPFATLMTSTAVLISVLVK